MHPFYLLRQPVAPPSCPSHWSWSSLQEWRACPRRWWLKRATWAGIRGRYPGRIHPDTLPGILVHELIEEFAGYLKDTRSSLETSDELLQALTLFRPRDRTRTGLQRLIDSLQRDNPRTSTNTLMKTGLVDDCLNQFKRLISAQLLRFGRRGGSRGSRLAPSTVRAGHEIELRADKPPITGRLDVLQGGRIIDFKTGSPSPSHTEQLLFYASLYYAVRGLPPHCLTLVYTHSTQPVQLAIPSTEQLERMSRDLTDEIDHIVQQFAKGGLPEARCDIDNCAWCPVKQHCDEYWLDPSTVGLRAVAVKEHKADMQPAVQWCDLQLDELPPNWAGHGTCAGPATVNQFGPANIMIDRTHCPEPGTARPVRARLLGARITRRYDAWEVTTSPLTEVFWA